MQYFLPNKATQEGDFQDDFEKDLLFFKINISYHTYPIIFSSSVPRLMSR